MKARYLVVNTSKLFSNAIWRIFDFEKRVYLIGSKFTFSTKKAVKNQAKKMNTWKVFYIFS